MASFGNPVWKGKKGCGPRLEDPESFILLVHNIPIKGRSPWPFNDVLETAVSDES